MIQYLIVRKPKMPTEHIALKTCITWHILKSMQKHRTCFFISTFSLLYTYRVVDTRHAYTYNTGRICCVIALQLVSNYKVVLYSYIYTSFVTTKSKCSLQDAPFLIHVPYCCFSSTVRCIFFLQTRWPKAFDDCITHLQNIKSHLECVSVYVWSNNYWYSKTRKYSHTLQEQICRETPMIASFKTSKTLQTMVMVTW